MPCRWRVAVEHVACDTECTSLGSQRAKTALVKAKAVVSLVTRRRWSVVCVRMSAFVRPAVILHATTKQPTNGIEVARGGLPCPALRKERKSIRAECAGGGHRPARIVSRTMLQPPSQGFRREEQSLPANLVRLSL